MRIKYRKGDKLVEHIWSMCQDKIRVYLFTFSILLIILVGWLVGYNTFSFRHAYEYFYYESHVGV